ncbi:MAG: YaeQ family protein [Porticoccaceae bacterium]
MAIKATIFKCELVISDLERHYYQTHNLTIARHPSETGERMMLRILMFAIYASDRLEMTKGISTDNEPDLSAKIAQWRDRTLDRVGTAGRKTFATSQRPLTTGNPAYLRRQRTTSLVEAKPAKAVGHQEPSRIYHHR